MLKPLHDNVILKKEEVENKTTSGIILSGTAEKKSNIAVVVSVGPDSKAEIKKDDKVVYKEYSGTNVTLNDEEFIIIEDEDILAVLGE